MLLVIRGARPSKDAELTIRVVGQPSDGKLLSRVEIEQSRRDADKIFDFLQQLGADHALHLTERFGLLYLKLNGGPNGFPKVPDKDYRP